MFFSGLLPCAQLSQCPIHTSPVHSDFWVNWSWAYLVCWKSSLNLQAALVSGEVLQSCFQDRILYLWLPVLTCERMEEEMKASGLPHSALVGEPGTLGMSKGAGWNDGGRCPSVQRSWRTRLCWGERLATLTWLNMLCLGGGRGRVKLSGEDQENVQSFVFLTRAAR